MQAVNISCLQKRDSTWGLSTPVSVTSCQGSKAVCAKPPLGVS